jgi:hypothetical protein
VLEPAAADPGHAMTSESPFECPAHENLMWQATRRTTLLVISTV